LSDSVTVIKQGKVVGNVLTKDTSEEELAANAVVDNPVVINIPAKVPAVILFNLAFITIFLS
jgi:ABC-type uncharacterized transport system ATPase subunit